MSKINITKNKRNDTKLYLLSDCINFSFFLLKIFLPTYPFLQLGIAFYYYFFRGTPLKSMQDVLPLFLFFFIWFPCFEDLKILWAFTWYLIVPQEKSKVIHQNQLKILVNSSFLAFCSKINHFGYRLGFSRS